MHRWSIKVFCSRTDQSPILKARRGNRDPWQSASGGPGHPSPFRGWVARTSISHRSWPSVPWSCISNRHSVCRGWHSPGTHGRNQGTWSIGRLSHAHGWCMQSTLADTLMTSPDLAGAERFNLGLATVPRAFCTGSFALVTFFTSFLSLSFLSSWPLASPLLYYGAGFWPPEHTRAKSHPFP